MSGIHCAVGILYRLLTALLYLVSVRC